MNLIDIFQNYNTDLRVDISPRIISCFFDESIIQLLNSLHLKPQYYITPLHISEYQTNIDLITYLIFIPTDTIIGRFNITCISKPDNPHLIFSSLTISIDDEIILDNGTKVVFKKKGLSRILMGINLQLFYNIIQNENKNLIIDADASGGFWEKIGMIDTPYDIDDDRTGYDKFILLKDAYKWALKRNCTIDWCLSSFKKLFIAPLAGKKKTKKYKKSKKSKKSKRNKRSKK